MSAAVDRAINERAIHLTLQDMIPGVGVYGRWFVGGVCKRTDAAGSGSS